MLAEPALEYADLEMQLRLGEEVHDSVVVEAFQNTSDVEQFTLFYQHLQHGKKEPSMAWRILQGDLPKGFAEAIRDMRNPFYEVLLGRRDPQILEDLGDVCEFARHFRNVEPCNEEGVDDILDNIPHWSWENGRCYAGVDVPDVWVSPELDLPDGFEQYLLEQHYDCVKWTDLSPDTLSDYIHMELKVVAADENKVSIDATHHRLEYSDWAYSGRPSEIVYDFCAELHYDEEGYDDREAACAMANAFEAGEATKELRDKCLIEYAHQWAEWVNELATIMEVVRIMRNQYEEEGLQEWFLEEAAHRMDEIREERDSEEWEHLAIECPRSVKALNPEQFDDILAEWDCSEEDLARLVFAAELDKETAGKVARALDAVGWLPKPHWM